MDALNKVIYFPVKNEIGCQEAEPVVLVVTKVIGWNNVFNGITLEQYEKKLPEKGWGAQYSLKRCIPFTDAAWKLCQDYIERKQAMSDEYKTLQSVAKKAATHEQGWLL